VSLLFEAVTILPKHFRIFGHFCQKHFRIFGYFSPKDFRIFGYFCQKNFGNLKKRAIFALVIK
jgi:hypothetical protein